MIGIRIRVRVRIKVGVRIRVRVRNPLPTLADPCQSFPIILLLTGLSISFTSDDAAA